MATATCQAAAATGNKAAVLHGIDDLRLEDWPMPDKVAPGHVSSSNSQGPLRQAGLEDCVSVASTQSFLVPCM